MAPDLPSGGRRNTGTQGMGASSGQKDPYGKSQRDRAGNSEEAAWQGVIEERRGRLSASRLPKLSEEGSAGVGARRALRRRVVLDVLLGLVVSHSSKSDGGAHSKGNTTAASACVEVLRNLLLVGSEEAGGGGVGEYVHNMRVVSSTKVSIDVDEEAVEQVSFWLAHRPQGFPPPPIFSFHPAMCCGFFREVRSLWRHVFWKIKRTPCCVRN